MLIRIHALTAFLGDLETVMWTIDPFLDTTSGDDFVVREELDEESSEVVFHEADPEG